MRSRVALLLYLAAVVALTMVHDPRLLAAALLLVLVLAGRRAPAILRRSALALLWVNGVVSLGYAALARVQGEFQGEVLLRLNLRVLALCALGFLFAARVDLLRALSFSRTLAAVATVAHGQIQMFRRLREEHALAFRSRLLRRPRRRELARELRASAGHLLARAVRSSAEMSQAMRARGLVE